MKKALLTGIAVLFLATGTAHAEDSEDLGTAYDCGSDHDAVWIKREHVLSTMIRTIITMNSDSYGARTNYQTNRKTEPYPIIKYNKQTGVLTLNGKRCKEVK